MKQFTDLAVYDVIRRDTTTNQLSKNFVVTKRVVMRTIEIVFIATGGGDAECYVRPGPVSAPLESADEGAFFVSLDGQYQFFNVSLLSDKSKVK